ncbi:MAG: hypothetical protein MUF49_11355 [Oculatellaceae cyanobacterium Prado106]|nr:hypothetical protein [Oculatellaceae cyanobacterium Prado106]
MANNAHARRPLRVDRLGCKGYLRRVMGNVIWLRSRLPVFQVSGGGAIAPIAEVSQVKLTSHCAGFIKLTIGRGSVGQSLYSWR